MMADWYWVARWRTQRCFFAIIEGDDLPTRWRNRIGLCRRLDLLTTAAGLPVALFVLVYSGAKRLLSPAEARLAGPETAGLFDFDAANIGDAGAVSPTRAISPAKRSFPAGPTLGQRPSRPLSE